MTIDNGVGLYHAYVINDDGFVVSAKILNTNDEVPRNVVKNFIPQGLYKPKWNGSKWIEGATQAEIDELTKPPLTSPTLEQRIAELENTLLNLLEVL